MKRRLSRGRALGPSNVRSRRHVVYASCRQSASDDASPRSRHGGARGCPPRPVPPRGAGRRRRHGRGVPRHRHAAAAHGGREDAARPRPRRPHGPAAVPAGSVRGVRAQSPQHLHRARRRRGRRPAVPRHGIPRRRDARRTSRPRADAARRTRRCGRPGGRRARRRPRPRHRASRHQARERVHHPEAAGQGDGLRPGEARRRRVRRGRPDGVGARPAHRSGDGRRHGGVHVAGAGARRADRRPQRRVLVRGDALRDGDGRDAVRGRHGRRDVRRPPEPRAGAPADLAARRARGTRPPHLPRARQEPGGAPPERVGVARRAESTEGNRGTCRPPGRGRRAPSRSIVPRAAAAALVLAVVAGLGYWTIARPGDKTHPVAGDPPVRQPAGRRVGRVVRGARGVADRRPRQDGIAPRRAPRAHRRLSGDAEDLRRRSAAS